MEHREGSDAALDHHVDLLFDRPVDHRRLTDKVERASRAIPRLRQRVTANTFSIAPPRWETDPNFDLRYHLRFVVSSGSPRPARSGNPSAEARSDVLAIASPEAMSGFDLARPLWQMLVVDGMADGRSAVIVKLHHTITDGIGGVKLGMHLFDLEASPAAIGPDARRARGACDEPMGAGPRRLGPRAAPGLGPGRPADTRDRGRPGPPGGGARRDPQAGGRDGSVAGRLLAPAKRPLSPIMTGRSLSVDLDTLSIPLADAKAAAKAAGGRLNDFFMAGVLGRPAPLPR